MGAVFSFSTDLRERDKKVTDEERFLNKEINNTGYSSEYRIHLSDLSWRSPLGICIIPDMQEIIFLYLFFSSERTLSAPSVFNPVDSTPDRRNCQILIDYLLPLFRGYCCLLLKVSYAENLEKFAAYIHRYIIPLDIYFVRGFSRI